MMKQDEWLKEAMRLAMEMAVLYRAAPPSFPGNCLEKYDLKKATLLSHLAARPLAVSGWQPIETAPKDGEPVLVGYIGTTLRGLASWVCDDDASEDYHGPGWFGSIGGGANSFWMREPTHWQPRPAPPSAASAVPEPDTEQPKQPGSFHVTSPVPGGTIQTALPDTAPHDTPAVATSAEQKLMDQGVYKGAHGLRGLAEAQAFWDEQPYGTRLYYGHGNTDYLHRSVLQSAVSALDASPAPVPADAEAMSLSRLNEIAKVYASSYASPHHITFTVDGLRSMLAQLRGAPSAPDTPEAMVMLTEEELDACDDAYEVQRAVIKKNGKAVKEHHE